MTSTVIATRGERLALSRTRFSGRDQRPEAFHTEVLSIVEIDADDRIAARVVFDPDDIDAAFEELDARYLAGEAAAHAHTWSVITSGYAALNRHELPRDDAGLGRTSTTGAGSAFAPGDLTAYIRAAWDLGPDISIYIEAVHRLSDLGAVVTHAAHGTSQEGFDAEWRDGRPHDGRRRPDQPLRDLRRGRPRRRARAIRRAQHADAATGKRGKPSHRTRPGIPRGPRLGRHGGDHWPTTFPLTIAVGW